MWTRSRFKKGRGMDYKSPAKVIKLSFSKDQHGECSIEEIKEIARNGNSSACEIYGDMLMEGMWDTYQMKSDIITGHLLEPSENPSDDPYLLLPRDPIAAIEYYRKAAIDRETARAKIEYCQQKGYAGLTKKETKDFSVTITSEMKEFLDKNAKPLMPLDLKASGIFDSIPDFRPKIRDPRTLMFKDLTVKWGKRSLYQLVFLESIAVVACVINREGGILQAFALLLLGLLTYGIPLIGHAMFCLSYADPKGVPLCSCNHLRVAYANNTKDFSAQIAKSDEKAPFVTNSFFIRNVHKIKQFWFWVLLIVSAGLIIILEVYNEKISSYCDVSVAIAFVILTMIVPFVVIMFWEKRFLSIPDYVGIPPFFIQIYLFMLGFALIIAPWSLFDSDCYYEYEKSEKKQEGIEKYIANFNLEQEPFKINSWDAPI